MREATLRDAAARLVHAERTGVRIAPLTLAAPDLSEDEAYRIAALSLAERGGEFAGYKLGYTSAAMRAQMNIQHPNYGVLLADMAWSARGPAGLVHPLAEPEIALRIGRALAGPGVTRTAAMASIVQVMAALEIVDTRYEAYRFQAADNIADNSSSARFALGAPFGPDCAESLGEVEARLYRDGELLDQGVGADALGDPVLALAWLANHLGGRGQSIPAGAIVLTGGLTRACPIPRGARVSAVFSKLGDVSIQF